MSNATDYVPVATSALKAGDHILGQDDSTATITSAEYVGPSVMFHPIFGPVQVETYDVRLHVDSGPSAGDEQGGEIPADAVWMVKAVASEDDTAEIQAFLDAEFDKKD